MLSKTIIQNINVSLHFIDFWTNSTHSYIIQVSSLIYLKREVWHVPLESIWNNRNMSLADVGVEMNRCKVMEPFFGNQLLNYQRTFSHNSLPSWYLQPFQREDEKVISLLQHSVNTTGNVSADCGHTLTS